jgi:hypothetical protein
VPVSGWSSSVQVSSDTDTRVVSAYVTGSTTSIGSYTTVTPTTIVKDTHGAWSGSTYTIPVNGYYALSATIQNGATTSTLSEIYYKIGAGSLILLGGNRVAAAGAVGFMYASGSQIAYCNAGDTITFVVNRDGGAVAPNAFNASINRLSGPSVIAATETVSASYYLSVSTTLNNTITTYADYPNKAFDTHGIYSAPTGAYSPSGGGWATTQPKWTIPVSGKYQITAANIILAGAAGSQNYGLIQIEKNGTAVKVFQHSEYSANVYSPSVMVNGVIQCNAGDVITIRVNYQAATLTTTTLGAAQAYSYLDITRVGN